jgi:hypothetical protein
VGAAAGAPAAAPQDERVRGWVVPRGVEPAGPLPDAVQLLDEDDAGRFVELPAAAVAALEDRGFLFRPEPEAFALSAGGRRFDVRGGEPDLPERWRARPDASRPRPYLVKFRSPVRPGWLAQLETEGATPLQYVPSFGYLVMLRGTGQGIGRLDAVEFTGEYHPAYKADEALLALADQGARLPVRLVLFDLPDRERVVGAVAAAGGRVLHRSEAAATSQRALLHYVLIDDFPAALLPQVLAAAEVYWAERWAPPQLEGERAAQILAGNVASGEPLPDYYSWLAAVGADGTGVTVAIADTGLDTGNDATVHRDVRGRTRYATAICADSRDFNGHGSNVAGIAGADGRAVSGGTGLTDSGGFLWGGGSAPGSDLYIQSALGGACPAVNADAATLAADAVGVGLAQIGNHSFTDGLGGGASYNSQAQAWDAVVRDALPGTAGSQPYTAVFSSGNSGPAASSLTSPKAAKNIVTVGGTENFRPGECPGIPGCGGVADDIDAVIDFSSRGPTSDGRIKPDVVAPGHVVSGLYSTQTSNFNCTCDPGGGTGCCDSQDVDGTLSYTRFTGTSQASPRVAGGSAVIHDWFRDRTGSLPSPAMNKAILVNSARDLKTPNAPNNDEGWGRAALRDVFQAAEGVQLTDQSVVLGTTGDAAAFTTNLFLQDPTAPLKATLVWTDPPGSINCNPCLVNNLDLEISQGATTWRGNNFTSGFTTAGGTNDTRNNVEGILLAAGGLACSPAFQVKVRAQTLAGNGVPGNADATDQDFALVVRNAGTSTGPPKLAVPASMTAGGCDGDAFLDREETVDLTLDVDNVGCGGGTGLSAQVSVLAAPPGASISVSPPGPQALPNLGAGASTQAVWQVSLGANASSLCGGVATLQVDLADGMGRTWQAAVDLILDGESLTPTSVLDPATTDQSASADPEWSLRSCRTTSAPTSWHMGQADCTGIVRDASTRSLTFDYALGPADRLTSLTFQHAFDGYNNGTLRDAVAVLIDHDANGSYNLLQAWLDGVDGPASMTVAGPYDLSPFDATRADTVSVRFQFQSAANWVGGPNNVAGWDVDDIQLSYDALQCDPATCAPCAPPEPVPDGSPGAPLLVTPSGPGIQLAWGAAAGATRYNVYQGTLGSFYSHASFADPGFAGGSSCHEPATSATIGMPAGSVYFLVAADSGCAESAYSFDSTGAPVPPASVPCTP